MKPDTFWDYLIDTNSAMFIYADSCCVALTIIPFEDVIQPRIEETYVK